MPASSNSGEIPSNLSVLTLRVAKCNTVNIVWVLPFAGLHFRCSINSGENEEKYFEQLFSLYVKEVKTNNLKIPSKLDRYQQAYLWLRSQPKFGSNFEDFNTKDVSNDVF